MSAQSAFQRGIGPLLQLLLPGREDAVLEARTDQPLRKRIEELAEKSSDGSLSTEERDEYAGYVRANKFVAVLRREAKKFKSDIGRTTIRVLCMNSDEQLELRMAGE